MTEPHITSNVTVDPGSIAAFAEFLSDMQAEIADIEQTLTHYADEHANVEFGAYSSSATAYSRHLKTVRAVRDNTRTLAERTTELVHGTEELASQYADLSALNASRSDDITTTLSNPIEEQA